MYSQDEDNPERASWFGRLHLSWPMLFVVGWLLYELTTRPTVGAVAVCLKFGWEDFRAAIWLRRVDPRRLRGRTCFWLYLASGLAKTAGVACLMSFAFVAVSPKGLAAQGPRWAAIMDMAAWTGLTMLAGLGCAILTLGYAVALARWGHFKLWLSRDVHRARRCNDWPPYGSNIIQNNCLNYLLIGASFVVFIPLLLLYCVAIIIIGQFNARMVATLAVGGMFLFMFAAPVLILLLRDWISRWLVASHPGECWEMDADSSPDAESMAEMIGPTID